MQLNQWQLLAAMQALSIYVLIRVEEGETDFNNFDSVLIAAVIVCFRLCSYEDLVAPID